MIPRILVPRDVRPVSEAPLKLAPQRTSSSLDERTLIPADMPVRPLDGHTSIPSHIPLDVLTPRTLVPRNLPIKHLEDGTALPSYLPLDILDSRVVVPRSVDPIAESPVESDLFSHPGPMPAEFVDILEPDLFTTGEVNFLAHPIEDRGINWHYIARVGSIIAHVLILILLIISPKLFPHHEPTADEIALARKELNFVYMPSDADAPRSSPAPASPHVRIDPKTIKRVAPTPEIPRNSAGPPVSQPRPDLPSAPAPQVQPPPRPTTTPLPQEPSGPVLPQPHSSNVPAHTRPNLNIPSLSPGSELEQSVHQALKGGGGLNRGFGDVSRGGSGGQNGGGGAGPSYLGGNLEMLTPTDGVDFTDYFQRLLAAVKRNWYAVIPESARLGDQGTVVIQFHIEQDGSVPNGEPDLTRTSGKEPLDRAAMAAIRASNPFEPLPPAFKRPDIEVRFTFLYNEPLNSK
jgi:TonB family protein